MPVTCIPPVPSFRGRPRGLWEPHSQRSLVPVAVMACEAAHLVEEVAAFISLDVISWSLESGPLLALPRRQGRSRLAVDFLACRGQCPEPLCIYHPHT